MQRQVMIEGQALQFYSGVVGRKLSVRSFLPPNIASVEWQIGEPLGEVAFTVFVEEFLLLTIPMKKTSKHILRIINRVKTKTVKSYKKTRLKLLGVPKKYEYEGLEIEVDKKEKWNRDLYLEKYTSSSDKTDFKIYSKYVHEGDTVIDVGAFMGYHTLKLSKEVGKEGIVYAFEPQKECFRQMQKMKKSLGIENWMLFNCMVGSESKTALMKTRNDADPTTNSVKRNPWNYDYSAIEKEMIRLDRLCSKKNIKEIDFVKIDVQGLEHEVLKGMKDVIDNVEKIYMEVHTKYIEASEEVIESMFETLNAVGDIYEVKNDTLFRVKKPEEIIYENYHPNVIWFRKYK